MPSYGAVPKAIRDKFPPPPNRRSFASDEAFEESLGYWRERAGRDLALAMREYRETPRPLLYRIVPHNSGVVFADPERAEQIAAIHEAIRSATSWGEFIRQMPSGELEDLLASTFDDEGEPRPGDDDPFSGEQLAGWSDGDYPSWLQQEQGDILPQRVLETFAQRVSTSINGSYWHIPSESVDDVCEALIALGFSVERKQELPFH